MSRITVLDSTQSHEWNACLNQMIEKDIYFSANYFRLFEREEDQRAEMFVFSQNEQMIMYPYLLRDISHLPSIQAAGLQGDWYDISTPYGYGGPISNVPPGEERRKLFREFGAVFTEYCKSKQILTEFIRFHPLARNAMEYQEGLHTERNRNTVYVDLTVNSETELLRSYRSNHKRNVQKAKVSHSVIRRSNPAGRLETFAKLYYATMEDLKADDFYFFPLPFLQDTFHQLEGRLELFEVMDGSHTVASCIVLHEKPWMHYHLCGWDRNYIHWSPTKLLIHEAALWGLENGFEKFHLGGGYKGDDKLYQFKSGFNSKSEPLSYHLGKRVFFPEHYDNISSLYRDRDQVEHDYFPIYRKPYQREESMA